MFCLMSDSGQRCLWYVEKGLESDLPSFSPLRWDLCVAIFAILAFWLLLCSWSLCFSWSCSQHLLLTQLAPPIPQLVYAALTCNLLDGKTQWLPTDCLSHSLRKKITEVTLWLLPNFISCLRRYMKKFSFIMYVLKLFKHERSGLCLIMFSSQFKLQIIQFKIVWLPTFLSYVQCMAFFGGEIMTQLRILLRFWNSFVIIIHHDGSSLFLILGNIWITI